MDALRVGVVGVGHLGQHHARILAGLPGVQLVGVADTRPDQGQRVAERLGVPGYADFRFLLPRVDAVTIAVPTTQHLAVGSEFLRRGIPSLIEKPLAADAAQGAALVRLAESRGCVLQVGHVERFNPAVLAVGTPTPPRYIVAERCGPYSFRSTDIGAVLDLMIHDLDLVLHWVGTPVERLAAVGTTAIGPHEDMASARLEFSDGTVADLHANRLALEARRRIQIWSDEGYVELDCMNRTARRVRATDALRRWRSHGSRVEGGGSRVRVEASGWKEARPLDPPPSALDPPRPETLYEYLAVEKLAAPAVDPLTLELEEFVECVRRRKRPTVDGRAALAALEVADAIVSRVRRMSWDMGRPGELPPILPGPHWLAELHEETVPAARPASRAG